MAVARIGLLLLGLALVQADPVPRTHQPAFIEDVRTDVSRGSSRVAAGWEADAGQIPHQASIRMIRDNGQVSSCGGSLIHHQWVLTAAHCLAQRTSFVVRLGAQNLTHPHLMVESTHKFIHPNYVESSNLVQTDDIALLKLDQHISYDDLVQPCRLMNSETKNDIFTGVRFTVSGYGLTDDLVNGGIPSEVLRWVYLRGITNEECRSWYSNSPVIQEQTICAEYYNNTSQSSCQGDSGGPLTIEDVDERPTMVGIVSFGSTAGCNSPWPSAYVRPGHYHDWFLEVTGISFDWKSEDLALEETVRTQDVTDEQTSEVHVQNFMY